MTLLNCVLTEALFGVALVLFANSGSRRGVAFSLAGLALSASAVFYHLWRSLP